MAENEKKIYTWPMKIGMTLLVVFIIAVLCASFYSIHRLNETVDSSNREVTLNYSNLISKRLHDRFEIINMGLEELILDLDEQQINQRDSIIDKLMFSKTFWEVSECGIMYKDGTNIKSDGSPFVFEEPIDLNDVSSYAEQLNVSTQYINGKALFVLAKPCDVGDFIGVYATIEMETLIGLLGDFGYSNFNFLAITSANGDNEWKQGEDISGGTNCFVELANVDVSEKDSILQMQVRMSVKMSGALSYEKDRESYYLGYSPLEINDWFLLVSIKSSSIDLTAMSREYFSIAGILMGVIVTLAVVGVIYLLRRNANVVESNRRLHEATILANQANAAKRNFLAKISHEIRTPLNGVMGMINLAKNEVNHQGQYYLDKASASADYLLEILNDVLDMSKIESGKQRLIEGTVDLTKMKTEILDMMQANAEQKNITINVDDNKISHHYFLGDYVRIKQIIVNLLSNAIKYTQNEGTVEISLVEEAIENNNDLVNIIIKVRDNGFGIAKEKQELIFIPFEQASLGQQGGVGLGLPIVKSFVELMNGTITLDSEVGKGSTFTVTIPLHPFELTDIELNDKDVKNLKGLEILLAEDNEINAEIAIEFLKTLGANVTLTVDGVELVEKFNDSSVDFYDAILVDIQMPRKNGIEATRDIRKMKRPDASNILIIAMTADAFAEQKVEMLKAGINDILFKPINIDGVCSCILKHLERRKQ